MLRITSFPVPGATSPPFSVFSKPKDFKCRLKRLLSDAARVEIVMTAVLFFFNHFPFNARVILRLCLPVDTGRSIAASPAT
jgi:hypothetical protein